MAWGAFSVLILMVSVGNNQEQLPALLKMIPLPVAGSDLRLAMILFAAGVLCSLTKPKS